MDKAHRSGAEIRLPRAGTVLNFTVTTAAAVVNLATAGGPAAEGMGLSNAQPPTGAPASGAVFNPAGWVERWIDIYADGADLGIVVGDTSASVSATNAPVLATTGTTVATAGQCWRIPNGTYRTYFVTSDSAFLGVVASAAGTMRIAASSRAA